jgi:hypothetical protein
MTGDRSEHESMLLPEGFTCGDCFAFKKFCQPVIGMKPDSTRCDYYPVRFAASNACLAELAAKRKESA